MTVFEDMLEDIFDSDIAEDAIYTPPGGPAVNVQIMPSRADQLSDFGDTMILSGDGSTFEIPVAALPSPVKNATIVSRGITFKVKDFRRKDSLGLIWFLDCAPA